MDNKIFDKILKGAKEAADYAEGKKVSGAREYRVAVPPHVDVKAIRRKLSLTQVEFGHMFGFSLGAIKKWETGQRQPDAAARVLIKVIDHNPEAVLNALHH